MTDMPVLLFRPCRPALSLPVIGRLLRRGFAALVAPVMAPMKVTVMLPVLLSVLLVACGDLPRPFEGAGRDGDPSLLQLRDVSTVRVAISPDLPAGAAVHLARAMARALRAREIPAYSDSQTGGNLVLRAVVEAKLDDANQARLDMTWVLENPDGLAIDTARASGMLAARQWFADPPTGPEETALAIPRELEARISTLQNATPDPLQSAYDGLVAEPAQRLAGIIAGDGNAPVNAAPPVRLVLVDFSGAPGDGNQALARSAANQLRARGIEVAKDIDEHSIVLTANITVSPLKRPTPQPMDQVKIEWVMLGSDGGELGEMTQNNAVPHGQLDEHWGMVATLAAQAAVEALEGALDQLARQKGMILRADRTPGQP